jgi:hypothetical protein
MRSLFHRICALGLCAGLFAAGLTPLLAGPSTSTTAYLLPTNSTVSFEPILTTGDFVGTYQMAGTPDGLGAFDNGDGTFTLLMNHEFTDSEGVAHTHNSSLGAAGKGSYVDRLVIRKADLAVLSGGDQITTIIDGATNTAIPAGSPLLNITRLCSADLPAPGAFFNAATGKGTTERIFLDGEESVTASNPTLNTVAGRAFAHIVTGPNNHTSYTLSVFPRSSFENLLANPASGDTTLVMANSDGGISGQTLNKVEAYVGTKTNTGNEIQRAGLTGGTAYQILASVGGTPVTSESRSFALGTSSLVTSGTFTLAPGFGGTTFSRPEDGAWDPRNPNDYYFVTTDQLDTLRDNVGSQVGRSRLWRLRFNDRTNPTTGGTIEAVLDGTEGQNMLDNIAVDNYGRVLMDEDTGNAVHNAKVWMYEIATDRLVLIGKHDPARFGDIGVAPTAPFTVDEESSGILDVSSILGPGSYLVDVQAHYPNGTSLVEGGQLLKLSVPIPPTVDAAIINDGSEQRSKVNEITVVVNGTIPQGNIDTGAFTVTRTEGGSFTASVSSVATAAGQTSITLGFAGDGVGTDGALPDGHYTISVTASRVRDSLGQALDTDNNGIVGGPSLEISSFHTLFGDVNGDGQISGKEVANIAHRNNSKLGTSEYLWFLDFDANGVINGKDVREVARRNGE